MRDDKALKIPALDRLHRPISLGDQVRFIMRGYFLAREQESFGKVVAMDEWGGIRIQTISGYRHFSTRGKVVNLSSEVYFVHHQYDAELRARVYAVQCEGHDLFISLVDKDWPPAPPESHDNSSQAETSLSSIQQEESFRGETNDPA